MTKMCDMRTLSAEMDAEDLELMEMFRNRKTKVDDMVMIRKDSQKPYLMKRDDLDAAIKRAEDISRISFKAGLAVIGCGGLAGMMTGVMPVAVGLTLMEISLVGFVVKFIPWEVKEGN